LKAPTTDGWRTICATPSAAIAANHASMTGPNSRPTFAVPRLWMRNSPTMMTTVAGTT
jgi:hypothetical protein